MKSSPEPHEKKKPAKARVLLPSFEEMMRFEGLEPSAEPGADADAAEPASQAAGKREALNKKEIDKTKELCANMRREALSEADRILRQASQEAVSIRDKARRETVKKLEAEAEAERKALRASIHKAAKAFHDAQDALYDELEPYFLDIALHISESILQYELLRDENAYLSIVRNALALYRSDGKERTLYLPPKGYALLAGEDGMELFLQQMQDASVRVEVDKRLAEGDCMVESAMGGVRAGVATQLSRIRYAASPEKED